MERPLTRRDLLKAAGAAAAGALVATPRLGLAAPDTNTLSPATADTVIVLWMAGGMASAETFDPKRYEPFSVGLEAERIISTFPAIDTAVDNIKICEGLEHIAGVMDRATLIRSHVQPDLGHILHSRHQYHWHTGYVPPLTVAAPHIGSWVARALGPNNPALPPFINIGQRISGFTEAEEVKAFTTAGFLGTEYGPFNLPHPEQAAAAVRPPAGMSARRFRERHAAYQQLLKASPTAWHANDYQHESLMRSIDNANRLLTSPAAAAFDLSLEPKESYAKYDTGRFGRGCLLARRLTESGARFIEVTTEYTPFKHWDTHENGHARLARLKQEVDRPIAQLVLDLEERGLLDRTLVVLASEFSRDMMIEGVPGSTAKDQSGAKADKMENMRQYGLHRHFTGGSSVVLFGGGVQSGRLYGETAAERPCIAVKDPVSIPDLHATLFHALGISPKYHLEIEKRPFYVTQDGTGKPVTDLFRKS